MKKVLLVAATMMLACLSAHAEEKFSYKCILNTPEIPRFNFQRTYDAALTAKMLRAPYAGYVALQVNAQAGEKLRILGVAKSVPKGVWDKAAEAFVEQWRLDAPTTGTHLNSRSMVIYVIFYTYTKPKYVVAFADISSDYVKYYELTPKLLSDLKKVMASKDW